MLKKEWIVIKSYFRKILSISSINEIDFYFYINILLGLFISLSLIYIHQINLFNKTT